jgi:hypothetical protein
MFWDTDEWKARAERQHRMHELSEQFPVSPDESSGNPLEPATTTGADPGHLAVRPPLDRGRTAVSELSDERSSLSEYEDAPEQEEKCRKCGGLSFSARRMKEGGTCLVCTKCGAKI